MKYGNNIKKLREELSMTQSELANLLGLQIRQIQRYENNETEPKLTVACAMADIFSVSLDNLAGRINNDFLPDHTSSEIFEITNRLYALTQNEQNFILDIIRAFEKLTKSDDLLN